MLNLKFNDSTEVYEIEFSQVSENIVQIKGEIPEDTSGFFLSRPGKTDRWDYSAFTTIYRVPENNVIQFSNDGSVYVVPTKDVVVSAVWDDGDNVMEVRPESVKVNVLVNGVKKHTYTLNNSNNWSKTIEGVVASDEYTIDPADVADYEKTVSGTTVTYKTDYPQPEVLTVDDLAEALAELADVVVQNSTDIVDTQTAVAEIYEMIVPEE